MSERGASKKVREYIGFLSRNRHYSISGGIGVQLAAHFVDDSNVIFGLMNEPNQQSATQWLGSANAAIAAIRDAHATQEILVPGSYWDGAWTWVSSDNDSVIGTGVKDPLHNFAFEVHQYLDSDGSGTHSNVVSATVGAERLQAVTQWAEDTGNRLFLGEFGVANDQTSVRSGRRRGADRPRISVARGHRAGGLARRRSTGPVSSETRRTRGSGVRGDQVPYDARRDRLELPPPRPV